jgi:hypothetical protein
MGLTQHPFNAPPSHPVPFRCSWEAPRGVCPQGLLQGTTQVTVSAPGRGSCPFGANVSAINTQFDPIVAGTSTIAVGTLQPDHRDGEPMSGDLCPVADTA